MKLFLASKAYTPETIKKLEEMTGGLKGKSIAYICTAANGSGWGSWKESNSWNFIQTVGADVTLVQLEDHWNSNPADLLKGKDIIWFGGGQCGYLMYWVRRTQLDKHLEEILEHGSLYVGSSAGSMITAPTLDTASWYIGEIEHGAEVIPGLGLVDFDIYPHYSDDLYDQIKKHYKGARLYLLKDGEAIIVEDQKVRILGQERLMTMDQPE